MNTCLFRNGFVPVWISSVKCSVYNTYNIYFCTFILGTYYVRIHVYAQWLKIV